VQSGFGWTNGVILDLLYLYGSSLSVPPLSNATNMTNNTNVTNTTSSSSDNRSSDSTTWIIPVAVLVPFIFLSVVCIIWGRWVYKRGKKRYWQRVQNEHLMAYGATEDSGQAYNIGELYENKYYASEHEEFNKTCNNTIKGNEDERHKSLPRQNSANRKNWYEQSDDSSHSATTIPAAIAPKVLQQEDSVRQDSGILSNRTSDNISDSTVVDKIDEGSNDSALQERDNTQEEDNDDQQDRECRTSQDNEDVSKDKQSIEIVVNVGSSEATQEPIPDKILTTDV